MFLSHNANMENFVDFRHPVNILVTWFTDPDNFANDLILKPLIINKSLLFSTIRNFWVNTKGVLTLVGPTRENLVFSDPAVLSLDNRLCMEIKYFTLPYSLLSPNKKEQKLVKIYFRALSKHFFEHIKGPLSSLYYNSDKCRPED